MPGTEQGWVPGTEQGQVPGPEQGWVPGTGKGWAPGTEQGEGRLHSKRSIGIGGHISSEDTHASGSPYQEGMKREIAEEVFLESGHTERTAPLRVEGCQDALIPAGTKVRRGPGR